RHRRRRPALSLSLYERRISTTVIKDTTKYIGYRPSGDVAAGIDLDPVGESEFEGVGQRAPAAELRDREPVFDRRTHGVGREPKHHVGDVFGRIPALWYSVAVEAV